MRFRSSSTVSLVVAVGLFVACSSSKSGSGFANSPDGGGGGNNVDGGNVLGGGGEGGLGAGDDGSAPPGPSVNPKTCDEAAAAKSYIGCDYWPTVLANSGVWSTFDFAVVVANAGDQPANVTVTGPQGTNQTVTVAPQQLSEIYLPWVPDLKGPEPTCEGSSPLSASVFSAKGAFHLTSSVPVTAYQFNPIEYQAKGGPPGKNWGSCPEVACGAPSCLSFSNDASLLLPSTAMTGNYRVSGMHGESEQGHGVMAGYFAVTGTQDGTNVTVKVSSGGSVVAGGKITATGPGGILTFTLDAGDVAEITSSLGQEQDLSGSQVAADKPVQVMAGVPCLNNPTDAGYCDHVEESVLPAETLGKHYLVTVPSGPHGKPVGHGVRIYGNVDGTNITGLPAACAAAATINAGQVVDCGIVDANFEVTGDHEFSIGSFQQGSQVVDPGNQNPEGDPSQSRIIAVEQFRTKYIFLAPADYDTNFIDIVAPLGTTLSLDGSAVSTAFAPVGVHGLSVGRVQLGAGQAGAHVITSDQAFGIQVVGYGAQTSYQYPGGLDLRNIAPPPPPPR